MTRIGGWSCKFSRLTLLFMICLGLVSVFVLPGPGVAATTASSTAYISSWSFAVSAMDSTTGATVDITNLLVYGDGPNSGSNAELNLGMANFSDANTAELLPWTTGTSISAQLPALPDPAQVSGSAHTFGLYPLFAQSNLVLTDGQIGDALFTAFLGTGPFTLPTGYTNYLLNVTAAYHVDGSVASMLPDGAAHADALVELSLSNFDLGLSLADPFVFPGIDFPPNGSFLDEGDLSIVNFALDPLITYDFEGSASTYVSGVGVPEPISLFLLGSGMIGLVVARKRSGQTRPSSSNT